MVPVQEWSRGFIQDLDQNWEAYLKMDVAPSTIRTYDAGVQRFVLFCQKLGVAHEPTPARVAQFLIGCARSNYALSTIRNSVSALQRWAADSYAQDGLGHDPLVVRAMKVAGRMAVLTKRQKLPLTAGQLKRIIDYVYRAEPAYIAARDSALFQVGWAGMLRSSELVGLCWEHVQFPQQGGVMLYLPQSKTDPGQGSWVLLAAGSAGISPALALRQLRLFVGGSMAKGPVFLPKVGAVKALAKATVAVRLRKALQRTGVENWEWYAAHSLRRGGATHAAAAGVPLRFIMLMGRWKSDVVREYMYYTPQQVLEASHKMLA